MLSMFLEYLIELIVASMGFWFLFYIGLYFLNKLSRLFISNNNKKFIFENIVLGLFVLFTIFANLKNGMLEAIYIGWMINIYISYRNIYIKQTNI